MPNNCIIIAVAINCDSVSGHFARSGKYFGKTGILRRFALAFIVSTLEKGHGP